MSRAITLFAWLGSLVLLSGCGHKPLGDTDRNAASLRAADNAARMVGVPYRYGGNSPTGFDCSGLVQFSYSRAGIKLPRDTYGQRQSTRAISQRSLQRGDLVFFDQEGKRSSHVGIYLGDNRFVHAPSSGKTVRIANLADRYWQQHFAGARRVPSD